MQINTVRGGEAAAGSSVEHSSSREDDFRRILNQEVFDREKGEGNRGTSSCGGAQNGEQPAEGTKLVSLGTISRDMPTVSNLLKDHPVYSRDTWKIVFSAQNRHKPYTKMQPGTKVYLNPGTLEIVWDQETEPSDRSPAENVTNDDNLLLGTISERRPTVSDLLCDHPVYSRDTWQIIHAAQNRDKPYGKMRPGTKVYLNPETLDIVWNHPSHRDESPQTVQKDFLLSEAPYRNEVDSDEFSEGLVRAVKPLMGRPYDELDCFQLVVQGLENLGIRYQGRGGLGEHLVKLAAGKGLPSNAYLNGEGLIEVSGSMVYAKSITKVQDSESQARHVFEEMKPLLSKGLILSFSTPTRGHTGIVSQRNLTWTYINSGNIDHQIGTRAAPKGVGEELLREEIKNWIKLAGDRKEPIQITLGRLNENKLRRVMT